MQPSDTKKGECSRCGRHLVLRLLDDRWLCWKCQRETSTTAPATEKQVDYLRRLGVCTPDGVTRYEAHLLISAVTDDLPYYVADVWRELTNTRLDHCGIPWSDAKRIAAMIANRDYRMAIDLAEVCCDRYFATLKLADELGVSMSDCHVPFERDGWFDFVADILRHEWNRYRPGFFAVLRRSFGIS
jgi:hypothetical protein